MNALKTLHSLKTMGVRPFGASSPLFGGNGELFVHSRLHNVGHCCVPALMINNTESADDTWTHMYMQSYMKQSHEDEDRGNIEERDEDVDGEVMLDESTSTRGRHCGGGGGGT